MPLLAEFVTSDPKFHDPTKAIAYSEWQYSVDPATNPQLAAASLDEKWTPAYLLRDEGLASRLISAIEQDDIWKDKVVTTSTQEFLATLFHPRVERVIQMPL